MANAASDTQSQIASEEICVARRPIFVRRRNVIAHGLLFKNAGESVATISRPGEATEIVSINLITSRY